MSFWRLMTLNPHKIRPLVVIHISDWECLENVLAKKEKQIWDILESHYIKIDKSLMPPFIHTADKFIKPGTITRRSMAAMEEIINKYTKNKGEE
jgi:hypothetical protein